MATHRFVSIYDKYFSKEKLQNDLLSLYDSLEIKFDVVDVNNWEEYDITEGWEVGILKTYEQKEYGRIVYLAVNNFKKQIYIHRDYIEYHSLKKRKRKYWKPKTNEELIELAKKELQKVNIYKRIFK